MVGIARQRHEFRASWWIRGPILFGLILWICVGIWGLTMGGLPVSAYGGVAFFVLFFVVFAAHYWRLAYIVDDEGVTVRGAHFPWETIESVRRSALPLVGWEVNTHRGMFVLDLCVGRRSLLLDVIVARAGLFPTPSP